VLGLREPSGTGVRVDSGLSVGSTVGSDYDPMLSKVIAWGPDRAAALTRLDGALADTAPPPVRRFGDLVLDEGRHEVRRQGTVVPLTAREFTLLATMAAHPGRVFTRDQLLERVGGDAYYDDDVVDVRVGNLRKKIEDDPAHPRFVETVRGVGYRVAVHET